ncbi:hypothetical protein AS589_12020 [Empedobacter brevis]|uniref:hypothetical protein n=1 Tax=Empedobacter brevis TaxID=247 RepID=UPI00131F6222|nr:hypothetical protein [Empedobacter brevis]QHC85459.1 hypothetical protein AS589_12020 [Empedobacter brevis]
MKDVISIDFELFLNDVKNIDFETKHSLSDADIVICCPTIDIPYGYNSNYRGKTSYDLNTSTKIRECVIHWKKEIASFLEAGKNIFIFLTEKEQFYLDSGRKETSGTGRNQKVTILVDEFHNYRILPISIDIHNSEGKKIISKNSIINTFIHDFKEIISYKGYIESKEIDIKPLILNKTQDKIVSGIVEHKNGNIIILPYLEPIYEHFYDKNDEFTEEGEIYQRKILKSILEIDKILTNKSEKSPKPEWLNENEFKLEKVKKLENNIKTHLESIKEIESKINILEAEKEIEESLLDLLFETGKPLEIAVIKALEILGYKAENFDNGDLELDQVIISPEKNRYIGECEGKDSKSIDITKFRQLQDSLNEDFQREEIDEKAFGLLFGNPFRNQKIEDRGDFFTTKCLRGAEREKIGLIKTTDLFFICKYLSENKNEAFKKKCREKIHRDLGKVIEFPKIPLK